MHQLLDKAKSFAEAAVVMLATGHADAAAGEAYYAMFNAARALLSSKSLQINSSKTHTTTIAQFGLHFVNTGLIDKRFGRLLNQAQELRRSADYGEQHVTTEDVAEYVDGALKFLGEAIRLMPAGAVPPDFAVPDQAIILEQAAGKLAPDISTRERSKGAADILVAIARGRGHEIPDHFSEKLVIYGSEERLLAMATKIDAMGDDLAEFARSFGIDVPSYGS